MWNQWVSEGVGRVVVVLLWVELSSSLVRRETFGNGDCSQWCSSITSVTLYIEREGTIVVDLRTYSKANTAQKL